LSPSQHFLRFAALFFKPQPTPKAQFDASIYKGLGLGQIKGEKIEEEENEAPRPQGGASGK